MATIDRVLNAMTVDVEDYFQVSGFEDRIGRDRWDTFESRVVRNTDRLLELFARHDVRATFFTLGWVAERFPDLVGRIAQAGHEVASHGFWHRLVYNQTPDEFRDDIRRARAALSAAAGMPILGYRAPSFSITDRSRWAFDVLLEEGHAYDASVFPIHHDRYGIPSAPREFHTVPCATGTLWECPASTIRVAGVNLPVGGGGYLRMLPYAYTRWCFNRINEVERRPVVCYLHPWEIDSEQPRVVSGTVSSFRHYRNIDKIENRLTRLVQEFRFAPLADVLGLTPVAAQPRTAAVPDGAARMLYSTHA